MVSHAQYWHLIGPRGEILLAMQAMRLDVFGFGRTLRYLLTGVEPSQTTAQALQEAEGAGCLGAAAAHSSLYAKEATTK